MAEEGSWDVRLFTASYSNESGEVVVELYGKTGDGRSLVVRHKGFRPYFHLVSPDDRTLGQLKGDPEVLKVEEVDLLVSGKKRDCAKVTIMYPWKVPEYRRKYGYEFQVLAADIPFGQRFIYDNDLGGCFRVKGKDTTDEFKERYTVDLVVEASGFEACEPFKPTLRILSFDIENSIKTEQIYTICCAIGEGDKVDYESISGKEKDILRKFEETVNRYDPDIITGYNIEGYDIPMITKRAKALKLGELRVGRDRSQFTSVGERFWRLHGRVIVDAWWAVKKEMKPKKETLGAVSKMLLGEGKLEVNPLNIDAEWNEDSEKVIKYCTKDAELALRILGKLDNIEKGMDLAAVARLPLGDAMNSGASTLIDSILIREADRQGIGVPMTTHKKGREKIEGGYVHSIKAGLYHWVCVLDFKSMYPSIIISNNICFTTLDPEGSIESPLGTRFKSPDKREGLIPKILRNLMEDRDEAKARRKAAEDEGERRYYDGLQDAIKVLMNSFYGVMASSFYRFTNQDIGASITAFARENTKQVISDLEEEGYRVVYSDTDSVFFQPFKDEVALSRERSENLVMAVEVGREISKRYSEASKVLEFEKVLEPLFSHGVKKRYAGRILWPEEGTIIRGYETRRTDAFDLQSQSLNDLFERILDGEPDAAIDEARGTIERVKAGKVPTEQLVISRTCREFNTYQTPDRLAWVQTAKKMMDAGYEFVPGMKVSWIVVDSRKTPQEVEPFQDGVEFKFQPDWEYYARRIASTLARATEVFGWDEKALLSGEKQSTLFSKRYGKKKKDARAEPTVSTKEMKLDDFF